MNKYAIKIFVTKDFPAFQNIFLGYCEYPCKRVVAGYISVINMCDYTVYVYVNISYNFTISIVCCIEKNTWLI